MIGSLVFEGIRHLREAARELHVSVRVFAEGVHGGAPGVEGMVRGEIVNAKVRLAEVV